jgi:hypothetical protein
MTNQIAAKPALTALSLGAGVQSTTLLLLAAEGALPKPDVAIFADTGWEPASVYRQLDRLTAVAADAGIELIRVSRGNLRTDSIDPEHRFASVPYFIRNPDGSDGIGRRQCTAEYKLAPIRRKIRELPGAAAPNRRVPTGRICEQWVGFSLDEVARANRQRDSVGLQYLRTEYPLLDLGMTRKDCQRWLAACGWGETPKSACIRCPFHGNRAWRDLRDNHPDEWADAVAFDAAIRRGGARGTSLRGTAYLHRSRVPLDQAPIDRVTAAEWSNAQGDVFDAIAERRPRRMQPLRLSIRHTQQPPSQQAAGGGMTKALDRATLHLAASRWIELWNGQQAPRRGLTAQTQVTELTKPLRRGPNIP